MVEKTLFEIALEEFNTTKCANYIPLYPAVLVRVLPKEKVSSSGIIYGGKEPDKPTYEGIVLRTYQPRTVNYKGKDLVLSSELKPGDHVLFPHWSGESLQGLQEHKYTNPFLYDFELEHYRVIPDRSVFNLPGHKETGSPICIVEHETEPVEKILTEMVEKFTDDISSQEFIQQLLDKFDIVPKITTPATRI